MLNNGDYIIRGVKGEIYPCKEEVFDENYKFIELKHVEVGDTLTNKAIYLDESNYFGEDAGDIIVWNENLKIYSEANEKDKIIRIVFEDKTSAVGLTKVLYENGKRLVDKLVFDDKMTMPVQTVDKTKVAYEFFRIEQ